MSRALLTVLAVIALFGAGGVTSSGADFAASTASSANSFAAAADFNTVAVTLTAPSGPLRGNTALSATASSERGIERVRFESSPAGADTWTVACDDQTAPYTCDWDTTGVADGSRDLRAVAIDNAGYMRSSDALVTVDNTRPVPALADPGYLQGSETLTATATDATSGIASIALAYRPASGGSWTSLCTGTSSPLSCALATGGLADGPYELRVTATDGAGNSDSTVLTRTVDNNAPTSSVTGLPAVVRGTITVSFSAADGAGSGVKRVTGEMRPAGGTWTALCTDMAAPYECTGVNTALLVDGNYEVRVTAEDDAGLTAISAVSAVRVDNTAPPVPTLAAVAATVQGTVALSGTVTPTTDVASWIVRYRPAGGPTWTDACSDATSPYACDWDTTAVADGLYDVRAVARDAAGNETVSATQTNRRVDNDGPTVNFPDPGAYLRGTVALTATASDPAGVQWVVFERRLAGATNWTIICADFTAPYTCSWNTTSVADGSYELRFRASDPNGHITAMVLPARPVDNTAPAGAAVESGNGGATAGLLEPGDWLRLTWTEQVAPASVMSGWDGSAAAIRVQVTNNGGSDQMSFWDATGTTRLGLADATTNLRLNANFVTSTTWFDATMAQSGAAVTVTLGAHLSGNLNTAAAANMRWRPSATATDLAGNPAAVADVNESNPSDRDF